MKNITHEETEANLKAAKGVLNDLMIAANEQEWAIEGLFLIFEFLAAHEAYTFAMDSMDALKIYLYERTSDFNRDFKAYSEKVSRLESWKPEKEGE